MMKELFDSTASFLVPYCVDKNGVSIVVQNNPKHGFHLIGGKREEEETRRQCLDRELQEELGLPSSLLAYSNLSDGTDVSFRVQDSVMVATLYTLEMCVDDARGFVHDFNRSAEFELLSMDVVTLRNEKASEVTSCALDWLIASLYRRIDWLNDRGEQI